MDLKCRSDEEPVVAVLLSSYNGEKYIAEQIESIMNQTYQKCVLYIRDDGSEDSTVDIIKECAERYKDKIRFYTGKNIGFVRSFQLLLKHCDSHEYYAWCDQDDVWMPEKIERAVCLLEKDRRTNRDDGDVPVLYFSDYDYYDESMIFVQHGLVHNRGPSFENALFDCISLGICSVFNQKARSMMLEKTPRRSCGHDWWTYMLCAAFGRVIYDKGFISVKYRRIEESVSPGGMNFISLQIWRIKKFILRRYFHKIHLQIQEFCSFYADGVSDEKRKLLQLFEKDRVTAGQTMKKVFYPAFFRQNLMEELMLRICFLVRLL